MTDAKGPLARVRWGHDEIGIYDQGDDWLRLVFYSHQGDCTLDLPTAGLRPLGEALIELSGKAAPVPDAARALVLGIMRRHGIRDEAGFTCLDLVALWHALGRPTP